MGIILSGRVGFGTVMKNPLLGRLAQLGGFGAQRVIDGIGRVGVVPEVFVHFADS